MLIRSSVCSMLKNSTEEVMCVIEELWHFILLVFIVVQNKVIISFSYFASLKTILAVLSYNEVYYMKIQRKCFEIFYLQGM